MLSVPVNPQITNSNRSRTTPKEFITLSVLVWLCLFFSLPFQHEKKSSKALIKGGFLIIPNERTDYYIYITMSWLQGSGKPSAGDAPLWQGTSDGGTDLVGRGA